MYTCDNITIIICYNVVINKLYKQQEKSDTELLIMLHCVPHSPRGISSVCVLRLT